MPILDAQAQALLDRLARLGLPSMHTLLPAAARIAYKQGRKFSNPPSPAVAAIESVSIPSPAGDIGARLYRPAGHGRFARLPVLVFFHGGGFVIGDLDTHDVLCRQLCNRAGCVVIAIDYRLAPEHKFPAAFDDSLAATRWIAAHAQTLGIDSLRVAVGGDSAGGNLAAAVALAIHESDGPKLAFQLLIYPMTDQRNIAPSYQTHEGYLLTRDVIRYYRGHYLNHDDEALDWRVSPLLAKHLAGLPPALVLTAGFDPLHDEGLEYAQRMRDSGVKVKYRCFDGQFHGFILMGGVIDDANRAVEWCAATLAQGFAGTRP